MKLRRLDPAEHGKTRRLWEEVFSDDTKAFLDYYYYIKTRDNAIYVIEEDGEICSMLQLNPYTVRVEGQEFPSAYIIAVATRKEYRSRGYMGALLRASLKEMYSRGLPFTFLMPAAEAIYTPYDFRYIYSQDRGTLICGERDGGIYWKSEGDSPAHFEIQSEVKAAELGEDRRGDVLFSDAGLWDAEEMSHFFETYFADRFQVCTVRDAAYYQTMILEQQSERGGVRLIRRDGALKGFYAYAKVIDKNGINKLVNIVDNNISATIEKILNADFKIEPKRIDNKNISCKFCPFKDICYVKENDIKDLKETKFKDIIGGEESA